MKSPNKWGFTLVELSIVLVILGLIIGTVAPLFVSLSKRNKISDGRQVVTTAKGEIKGEIVTTRTVPADLSNVGHDIDPWQSSLIYIPAPNLSGQDLCTWLASGSNQTGLAVCIDGDCASNKKDNIAYVVGSIGSNLNRQIEAPAHLDSNFNDLEVRLFDYGTTTDLYTVAPDLNSPTDQFDDIVQYVAVSELLQLINCSVNISNQTGQTICSGGAAILDGVDIGVIQLNQLFALGSTVDNCITIDNSCQITYANAQNTDTNRDGNVQITSPPPGCNLQDM